MKLGRGSAMRIVPVIDLLGGVVVRGVAGRREEYRPLVSSLAPSAEPGVVACALASRFAPREIYVADLDAITADVPDLPAWRKIAAAGPALWLDAGLRSADQAAQRRRDAEGCRVARWIAGLESLPGPQTLAELLAALAPDPVTFSLDLRGDAPIFGGPDWPQESPCGVAERVLALGVRSLIVLDLTRVGTPEGPATLELCRTLRHQFPELELVSGGGVRCRGDLASLQAAGCDAALVASSLHDGRLTPSDCLVPR